MTNVVEIDNYRETSEREIRERYAFRRVGPGRYLARQRAGRGCADCGAFAGELHHPICDTEDCPHPDHGQAISCDCAEVLAMDERGRGAVSIQDYVRRFGMIEAIY